MNKHDDFDYLHSLLINFNQYNVIQQLSNKS